MNWRHQIAESDKATSNDVYVSTRAFYDDNNELYETANKTTGDTAKHLQDLTNFLEKLREDVSDQTVLDIGCGNGIRMTLPMANMLPASHIVGIDQVIPVIKGTPTNLNFIQGDFCKLPVADSSIKLATAHWSVLNDLLLRSQQLSALTELKRALLNEGLFYFDVPILEGEGGYQAAAHEYHKAHLDELYGTIEREFPGQRTKKFYIYPSAELDAMLNWAGFKIESSVVWLTQSGCARRTVVARFL